MKIRLFYHSLVSDWNHGNAHFLRGIATELFTRGHDVVVYEPADGWSVSNLIAEHGMEPLHQFRTAFPKLKNVCYDLASLDPDAILAHADLVIVHEWNDAELVRRIGQSRSRHPFVLLFHDTHHRMVTDPSSMRAYDLSGYDGVLAFGNVLRDLYLAQRIVAQAWTWHEAADIRTFQPIPDVPRRGDVVWIGNWADDERTAQLKEFLIDPIVALRLKARVHGVRYPEAARAALASAGIDYAGWLPNHLAPRVFAEHAITLHIPRQPYVQALPGIPTIRPLEALACGIPLICSPWTDTEGLFTPGADFLVARDGSEMKQHLTSLLRDPAQRRALAEHGLATIQARHTCGHRVDELLTIHDEILGRRSATVSRHQDRAVSFTHS